MNGISPNRTRDSPKTPGGISKSLLTPCRRIGLSRKWRKSGSTPFISPISGQSATPERTVQEVKKRKKSQELDQLETNNEITKDNINISHNTSLNSPVSTSNPDMNMDITSTPCRNTPLPRKKSKKMSVSIKNSQESDKDELVTQNKLLPYKEFKDDESQTKISVADIVNINNNEKFVSTIVKETPVKQSSEENISKLIRTDSKGKKLSLKKSQSKSGIDIKPTGSVVSNSNLEYCNKKSPNNLTKECIVVIQKKILKTDPEIIVVNKLKTTKQDSDSEYDVPLSAIKKENNEDVILNTLHDDDFLSKTNHIKPRNLSIKRNKPKTNNTETSDSSQSSQEDISKRTILVKKTYDKVIKPQKAKSTGSITQKDIDELKARIEMKKKLLLAKAMSVDTEELRALIKKWQKGCQDALMELLDLMKKKLPDRQNMDYSEILGTLKIPPELVGYDCENDCFVTPDDTTILLSAFKL